MLSAEERYHLRNALYTACKVGDKSALRSLLAIFNHPAACVDSPLIDDTAQQGGQGAPVESGEAEVLLPVGVVKGEEISQADKDGGATPEGKENIPQSVFETENVKDESFHQGEGDFEIKVTDCGNIDNNRQEYTENVDPLKGEDAISEIVHHDRHKNGETLEKESSEKMTSTKPAGLPGLTLGLAQPTFELSPLFTVEVLNEPFGDNSTTLLHVASKGGHPSLIRLLMKAGADPAVK